MSELLPDAYAKWYLHVFKASLQEKEVEINKLQLAQFDLELGNKSDELLKVLF